jgi:hypothetical protein
VLVVGDDELEALTGVDSRHAISDVARKHGDSLGTCVNKFRKRSSPDRLPISRILISDYLSILK